MDIGPTFTAFSPDSNALPVTDDDNRQRYRVDVLSRHTLNVYLRDRLELPEPRGCRQRLLLLSNNLIRTMRTSHFPLE